MVLYKTYFGALNFIASYIKVLKSIFGSLKYICVWNCDFKTQVNGRLNLFPSWESPKQVCNLEKKLI